MQYERPARCRRIKPYHEGTCLLLVLEAALESEAKLLGKKKKKKLILLCCRDLMCFTLRVSSLERISHLLYLHSYIYTSSWILPYEDFSYKPNSSNTPYGTCVASRVACPHIGAVSALRKA